NAVTCDIEPEKDESENIAEEDIVNDEDVVVLKSVGAAQAGKSGAGRRLRERNGKETKVAVEATKSPKKKVVGPSRSSSKVE
ncbi:hypothetical protein A2U01_0090457, partial [Trifolium medium]|nr:hypothetical protein [Trifolium medium]